MKQKKHPGADLEKKRGLFAQIGLIATLLIVWIALEWRNYDANAFDMGTLNMENIEEEIVPITERKVKPPPPPPPIEKLIIVDDQEEIKKNWKLKTLRLMRPQKLKFLMSQKIFQTISLMLEFSTCPNLAMAMKTF